jgi:eukaryotic-like serine/threonine-protein kinase
VTQTEDVGQRAYRLVDHALSLLPAQRDEYLRSQCVGDQALQKEVALLLRADAESAFNTGALRTFDLQRPADLLGRQIGRFRLIEYVGGGGMGVVYRAESTDGIAQRVAVKIVRQELRSPVSRLRFDLERASLARLEHAGIARLIDSGITGDHLPWYVMEFVDGLAIDEYCERHALPLEQRLVLLIDVCAAVDAAHRSLIVHRDIKPGNVLVTREGVAKLIDFGIARHLGADPATEDLTRSTGALFSAHYAAPEQVLGHEIGTMTDVFGLGALAFRLLTGKRIFSDRVRTEVDYLLAVTQQDVELPSVAAGNPALRGDIDNILCRALAREPARRYATAAELAAEFRRFLQHEPVEAHAPTIGYRLGKFVRRNRTSAALGVLLAGALLAGVTGFVLQSHEVAAQRDRATAEAARASLEASRSKRTNEFLSSMLQAPDPRLGNRDVMVASVLDEAVEKVDAALGEEPEVAAAVLATIANSDRSAARYPQALRAIDLAIAKLTLSGRRLQERAGLEVTRSEILGLMGQGPQATAAARAALSELTRLAPGSLEQANAQRQLAFLLTDTGVWKEAAGLFRDALETYRRRGVKDVAYARLLTDYSHLLTATERLREGEPLLKEAIDIFSKAFGPDHALVDDLRATLSGIYMMVGPFEAGRELQQRLLERRRRVLGREHPDTLFSQANLANTLVNMHRFPEALHEASEATAALRRTLGLDHQLTLYAQSLEANALCGVGRHGQGIALWLEVERHRQKIFEPEHYLIASARVGRGKCLAEQGKRDEAEPLLLSAVAMLERTSGPGYGRTQDGYRALAALYESAGEPQRAAQWRGKVVP